jgi:sirohydrochlorin ferrochelatase
MRTDNSPQAVLLAAHGSRVTESNEEIEALAGRLAAALGPGWLVSHAFLELARPSIPDAIDVLVHDGARHVVLVPYFLSAGRHVSTDIPAIVAAARKRHPGVEIETTGHFGAQETLPKLLAAMVSTPATG